MSRVLVTGGSGFIAGHVIVALLRAGHEVRATLRNLSRADEVKANVRGGGADPEHDLSFVVADLDHDAGWAEAVQSCDYVQHVASPLPFEGPENEEDLIRPARDGTLRVLKAARDAGVKRVVLTSSFAAIGYGHGNRAKPFTEADWSNLASPEVGAYPKSKTIAERAAWDFIQSEGVALELAVINPVAVFGPVLGPGAGSSVRIIRMMLDGHMRVAPHMGFGLVDVRDVADLHLRAMTDPKAKGERFLAVAGEPLWMIDVARVLHKKFGTAAAAAPRREIPNWVVRLLAPFVPMLRQIVPQLGILRRASNEKARQVLGWSPRTNEEAIAATGESLLRLGVVKPRRS
ncbi:MAG: aldehyde reductase [Methylovirgula sp.]|uniref:SDR family oxidoreductase n=1 Tax=Methylovirgula sp. TaxID=1978224 RepID=UPI0030760175